MGFTKLDNRIADSSIWDEESNVLKVFLAFWTKSDPEGIVNATYNAMYRTANLCDKSKNLLPITSFDEALNILLSPDPTSRSKNNDGRRIVKLDESKWLITNYKDYREHTYSDNPEAIRKRKYRSGGTCPVTSKNVLGHSASASLINSGVDSFQEEESEGKPKIEVREEAFREGVFKFTQYPQKMLLEFFNYWSEYTRDGKHLLFETKKTWDLSKRLARWNSHEDNYGRSKKATRPVHDYERDAAAKYDNLPQTPIGSPF